MLATVYATLSIGWEIPALIVACSLLLLFFIGSISSAINAQTLLSSQEKKEVEESDKPTDLELKEMLMQPEKVEVTAMIGHRFFGIFFILVAGVAFVCFVRMDSIAVSGYWIILVATLFLLFLLTDLMPAYYVRNNPLKYARRTSGLMLFFVRVFSPLSSWWIKSSQSFEGTNKKKPTDVSVGEISKALEMTSEDLSEEKDILKAIITLHNRTVVEIMTPRMDISAVQFNTPFRDIIEYIIEVAYSRIPVYGENQDDIKGVLYIKDLLPHLEKDNTFYWQKLIRPVFYVPETKKVDGLLEEFRINRNHMAIVVDEFGGTSGIVTLEDILEEIVGEISDEYDDEEERCIACEGGSFLCDAKIPLTDFFRTTNIDEKSFGKLTDEVDTLAGLVLEIKGDFPEQGEIISHDIYSFEVLEMDDKRIAQVRFTIQPEETNEEE